MKSVASFSSCLFPVLALLCAGCGSGVRTAVSPAVVTPTNLSLQASVAMLEGGQTSQLSVQAQGPAVAGPILWSLGGACAPNCGSMQITADTTSILYTAPATIAASGVTIQAQSATAGVAPAAVKLGLLPALVSTGSVVPATGMVGNPYTATLLAGGGLAPYAWSVSSGSVPAGLVLDASTGALTGQPTTNGVFNFEIKTTDAAPTPGTVRQSFSITVADQPVTARAAARLLEQSSFGPTAQSIQHVQAIGMRAYLNEQFSMPATYLPSLGLGLDSDPKPNAICESYSGCNGANWWKNVLFAPDQLRQRIAFALTEIMVVSDHGVDARGLPLYYNTLLNTAFSSYRDVMGAVSTNPAMGVYLSMIGNTSSSTSQANENYARELMQLFTLGTVRLNDDGTQKTDSFGNAIPVYSQDQVRAFARAYTGWMWALPDGSASGGYVSAVNYAFPLVPVEALHETTAKTLLNGQTLPAGQTTQQDLDSALTNVFNDSNIAPFVATRLIQHLVTGDPSPAYVQRISSVFKDNGAGKRGDLRAVVTAILLDPEARAGDAATVPGAGHLKQPLLWESNLLRGLGASPSTLNAYVGVDRFSGIMGQHIMSAPSVFGFYSPNSVLPGTQTPSPEFGLDNTALITARMNVADQIINLGANGFIIDLSPSGSLAASMQQDSGACLDQLNQTLLHGTMPSATRTIILNQISGLSSAAEKLRLAVYLVATSNEYSTFD